MADQWNSNIPAVGNQISNDIPDIKENLEHARDSFERIFETWSTSNGGNASAKFDSATGFSDGTYNYEFPTNGVGDDSVIMLGTSSTIVWMYLNTAPPGWKVLATGADRVLGISGGSQAYNVNGGNTAGSWTLTGYSSEGAHTHSVSGSTASETNTGSTYKVSYSTGSGVLNTQAHQHAVSFTSGSGGAHTHTHDGTDRMAAAVGKLFQLDTA